MKIGRNAPCPCGSGKKYKRCCLARRVPAVRFTRNDRASAFAKLERYTENMLGEDDDEAPYELWGDQLDRADELGSQWTEMSEAVQDMWFFFDRPLADGDLAVDRFLSEGPLLSAAERRFLLLCRETVMRPYVVEQLRPGISVTLREALDGHRVTVHEEAGSRSLRRADLLAVRVIRPGCSGEPEMERGMLQIPRLTGDAMLSQLSGHRRDFRRQHPGASDVDFYKQMVPFFHSAWAGALLDPAIPRLQNTDGEDLLPTRTRFEVLDRLRLEQALDTGEELERGSDGAAWSWSGANARGEVVSLGRLELDRSMLVLETNSAARDRRGRDLVEALAGEAVRHQGTVHEDLERSVREALRSGDQEPPEPDREAGIPPELAEELVLDHQAHHYRAWLEMELPALDGSTPRQAAEDPELRPRLAGLIRDLEGMYHDALKRNQPAYDPSWMWAELGLAEGAEVEHPPPLAHERWAEAHPELGAMSRDLAARLRRQPGFDDGSTVLSLQQLGEDLAVKRFLRSLPGPRAAGSAAGRKQGAAARRKAGSAAGRKQGPAGTAGDLSGVTARRLACMANHELHRRKQFWVDEALAFMLAETDLAVFGHDLRVPFPSFAVVFTSRDVLSLAERLVAGDPACPLAGYMLRVITVYLTEQQSGDSRVLHVSLALDALGADPPHLVEHDLEVQDDVAVALPGAADQTAVLVEGKEWTPARRPLPGLLRVTLNAVLYATSAGVEAQARSNPRTGRGSQRTAPGPDEFPVTTEEIFHLPGAIEISRLRQMQNLQRAPGGRKLLHRFMVRGHWRRPNPSWKDQRLRWVKPYWKGPDLAAVIERTYRLKP